MSLDTRNAALNEELEKNPIDVQVEALARADKRQSRQVILLSITVAFDVLLTIGFGYITIRTHQLANQAETNQTALVRNCETANASRKNNQVLWDYILAIPTPNAPTVEQQKNRDDFKAFVDKTFAPRDCQAEINK